VPSWAMLNSELVGVLTNTTVREGTRTIRLHIARVNGLFGVPGYGPGSVRISVCGIELTVAISFPGCPYPAATKNMIGRDTALRVTGRCGERFRGGA